MKHIVYLDVSNNWTLLFNTGPSKQDQNLDESHIVRVVFAFLNFVHAAHEPQHG